MSYKDLLYFRILFENYPLTPDISRILNINGFLTISIYFQTEPLKLYYIVFDCTKFVLDHGSTESDSSLLTDPGGGVTSIRRRKKIKGRRYKLGSNEDSDSPSECGATPSYVLRPVEMVREKRQRTESVEEQTLATEPNSADCQNLQDSVDINIKKESTYLSNMNDVTKVGEKTEGVAPETKTAASGGECTVDGKPDDTTSLSKDDNTEKSAEDFVMQVEEDADEEDIPLAVLKKKLTEQKVGAKELKQESCDVKDEGSHDQLEISCDNEDNANADSSDSDTTSYEVHSGVEENNVFSDVEDNEITTFNATSTKVIDTSTGDSNCSGGVENEQNSDIIHGDPKEALDKTEGKTLLSLTSDEKSTDTAKASALRSCTKEMAVTNRTSFGANSIVSPTMSTAPSSMEIATSTSQNPVIYVSACTTSVESVSKNAEKTATSSQLVTQVSKSMAMTFAVPGRTTDDKNTASTLASDSTVSTCTSSSSSSLSITSSQTVNNNYKLLEMKTSSASLPDSVSVSVSNCSNSQSSPTTTSAIPVDIKPVYLYHNPVSIADQVQTSCVLSSQVGGVLNCTNGMGPVSDHQPVYSQISHSYPTADGQLKKEVLDIKQNIVGCHRTASASKVNNKQTPSLATELLTQFGADVLQQINPLQKVETIVEGIKRKRGRPPKDKSKLLAQIKAQQSPAKLPRLLPKGINGNAGPFYHPGNPGHNNGHQANLQTSQLCPVSANMNSIQPYGCIAPLNGLSVFSANPMVNLSQLQNNTRMMASGATNTPYLQTVGNALYHHHHQPSQGPQQLVRPINGHFQNPMLSPTRPGLGGQQLDPMAAESKKQVLLGNHSNQCLDQPILPITIAPKMEKVEQ